MRSNLLFYDFNGIVNLPKVCEKSKRTGLEFVKMPNFGWFAYDVTKSNIMHLYDLFPPAEHETLFRKFTIEFTEFLDQPLYFTASRERTVNISLKQAEYWKNVFFDSRLALQNLLLTVQGKEVHLQGINAGLLTKDIISKYKIKLDDPKFENSLVIPSYITPSHICALDLYSKRDKIFRQSLYSVRSGGWMGDGTKVCKDLVTAIEKKGIVWGQNAEYWLPSPFELDDMEFDDRFKIWCNSRFSKFIPDIDSYLKANRDQVRKNIQRIPREKLTQLHNVFGSSLVKKWETTAANCIFFDGFKVMVRDGYYELYGSGKEPVELTNFRIYLDAIVRSEQMTVYEGTIKFRGRYYPFTFKDDSFVSSRALIACVKDFFIELGLGIATVLSSHRSFLLDVVERSNPNVKIVDLTELNKKTTKVEATMDPPAPEASEVKDAAVTPIMINVTAAIQPTTKGVTYSTEATPPIT